MLSTRPLRRASAVVGALGGPFLRAACRQGSLRREVRFGHGSFDDRAAARARPTSSSTSWPPGMLHVGMQKVARGDEANVTSRSESVQGVRSASACAQHGLLRPITLRNDGVGRDSGRALSRD